MHCIQGYFWPHVIFALLHLQHLRSVLILPRQCCDKRDVNQTLEFSLSSIFPLTRRVKRAKIKQGRIFHCVQYTYLLFTINLTSFQQFVRDMKIKLSGTGRKSRFCIMIMVECQYNCSQRYHFVFISIKEMYSNLLMREMIRNLKIFGSSIKGKGG